MKGDIYEDSRGKQWQISQEIDSDHVMIRAVKSGKLKRMNLYYFKERFQKIPQK